MVGVFAIFATLQFMFLKQFGVGLAVAVLVDATIVRAVLLPATMKLLGDWNWYLPRWLEWLPSLDHGRRPSRSRRRSSSRRLLPSRQRSRHATHLARPLFAGPGGPAQPDNREAAMTIAELHEHVTIASPPASAAVRLTSVSKVYGSGDNTVAALRELSLALAKGSFTAVMGPSGSGKSTFLHCAAGLDRPTSGIVRLGGRRPRQPRRGRAEPAAARADRLRLPVVQPRPVADGARRTSRCRCGSRSGSPTGPGSPRSSSASGSPTGSSTSPASSPAASSSASRSPARSSPGPR